MSDIQSKQKVVMPPQRHFIGKTEGFADNNERHFFQRMLKAYLAGRKFFTYKYKDHPVLQSAGGIGV